MCGTCVRARQGEPITPGTQHPETACIDASGGRHTYEVSRSTGWRCEKCQLYVYTLTRRLRRPLPRYLSRHWEWNVHQPCEDRTHP